MSRIKRRKYILPIIILGLLLVAVGVAAAVYNLFLQERLEGPNLLSHIRTYGDRLKEKDALKEGETLSGNTQEIVVLARKIYSDGEKTCVEDERQYDKSGNVIQRTFYDADGNISYWGECYYYTSGYLRWLNWYSADGRIGDCYEYKYDEAGNEIYSAYYINGNDFYSWTDREFDSSGHLMKEISYDLRGAVFVGRDEYEYDSLGRQVKVITYDESGEMQYLHEYEYDDHGNPVKDTAYDRDGTLFETIIYEYEYDAAGNMTKRITYNGDGSMKDWYEYEYMTITVIFAS